MSLSTNTTYRVLVEKLGASDPTEFIGNEGELFYDPSVPSIYLSDGSTAGGLEVAGGGGGGQWTTSGAGIYYSGGNVAIGGPVSAGSTVLMVHGDARITGILSVGTATITLDPNTNTVSIGTAIAISAEKESLTLGATDDIRRFDMGLSAIATATERLPGTLNFSGEAFSGQRVTTTAESGTVVSIPHQLVGPVGVASTNPTFGGYDDGAWEIVLPFDIEYIGITTNIVYATTNSYITFTGSATDYYLIDPQYGTPELPKIMISAGDSYSNGIYFWEDGVAPNRTYYVRYEGLTLLENWTSNTANTDQVIWEAVFYENAPSQIDIQIGDNPRYTSLNSPNVKLSIDGVIGFVDSNIRIGDKTTGCSLTNYNNYFSGVNNIFLGKGAGKNTSGGTSNNFFGLNSGYNNVNGSYNNFLGRFTGYCNINGSSNNFLGDSAGYNNVSGNDNNFLGRFAGRNNTTGGDNNFFGFFVGYCNTTGCHNNFFGSQAGYNNTTGGDNNFFGFFVGSYNTSGCHNNFLGCQAGYNNTTGCNNNFFGRYAGYNNTTGCNNNFLGNNAGYRNTTGNDNNFFGLAAGRYNATGSSNNFLGREAGQSNTTGSYNNFFGSGAGKCNTSGIRNTFIGSYAAERNTIGSSNFFGGYGAGTYNTTGFHNNFMGFRSGFNNTTGSYNNFFGSYSGISTSASNKVILGSGASGASALYDSPDTNKDTQFAVGVRTDSNPSKYWLVGNENFDVGIGTTNPQYKLDVGGDLNFTGTLYQNGTPFSGGGGSGAFSYCCTNNITSTDLTSHPDITTACHNFFAGVGAGCSITEGSNNNFFGQCAGYSNLNGINNVFIGEKAGFLNQGSCVNVGCFNGNYHGGSHNFFVGRCAGYNNAPDQSLGNYRGTHNTFIGMCAGFYNTTGYYNNFFGRDAGIRNTTGNYNNFLGYRAGRCNTTGGYNNFFGPSAGCSNTTGCYNNFFGTNAGIRNTTGCNNNFFGISAGCSNTTGCDNTFLGSHSGISTSASRKVILGSGNAYNQRFDSPDTNKDMQFAVGLRTDSNPSKYWLVGDENFNVGIGTTIPTSKLTVQNGDIEVGINTSQGLILTSPSGNKFRLIVDDLGVISSTPVV